MLKPVSQKPASFVNDREAHYWHAAQDIAFRAAASLVLRDDGTWLVFADHEELICQPLEPDCIWYETWYVLRHEFPALSRLWVGGTPISTPGEMG